MKNRIIFLINTKHTFAIGRVWKNTKEKEHNFYLDPPL